MKEKTIEEVKDNIVQKKKKEKLPKEISQEILKKIFKNLLKAICIMIYFVVLNLAYTKIKSERLIGDIQVFSGMFLLSGILALEKAYKKDSGEIAISAIELIFMSLHTLSIIHVINLFKYDFRTYLLTSSYIFSIYYVLKSIILYTKGRREYLKTLSDISDIVKKDEPIKKEAKKRNTTVIEDEENKKEEKLKESKEKVKKQKEDNKKENKPQKRRGRQKKEVKVND
ncbi:MAG: hypothetical protein HFJ40_01625 [Clostridia bacterium]|nr:hypothetical protein [Clostridia bacterium]